MALLKCYKRRFELGVRVDVNRHDCPRPAWRTGGNISAALIVRNEILYDFGNIQFLDEALTKCGLCGGVLSVNGAHAEHLIDWKAFAQNLDNPPTNMVGLEDSYHEALNLYAGHAGCNSSKGTNDVFDWWKSDNSIVYLGPETRNRVLQILQQLYNRGGGINWLSVAPLEHRKNILFTIIRTAKDQSVHKLQRVNDILTLL